MILRVLCRWGYRVFGKQAFKYRHHFIKLLDDIRMARLALSLDEYVAGLFLASLLAFVFAFLVSLTIFVVIYSYDPVLSFVGSIIVGITGALLVAAYMFSYPKSVAYKRREDIDARLAYAVTHMSTLAGTGVPLVAIFKAMTKMGEYGEVARECAYIVRDVEFFGKDVLTALADQAKRTPSKRWGELLWGVISTVRSGGDLRTYLMEKAKDLVEEYEREEKRVIESLNILTEIYMVAFVLAPVLGVVMVALMSLMGGSLGGLHPRVILVLLVYLILPLIGIVFLLLAESSKPKEVL